MPAKKYESKYRTRRDAGAGYLEQLEHANPARSLTKEEIEKLYPGQEVNLRKLTDQEAFERVRKNHVARRGALRKRNKF